MVESHHVDSSEDSKEPSWECNGEESEDNYRPLQHHYEDESRDSKESFPNGIYDDGDGRQWIYDVQMT